MLKWLGIIGGWQGYAAAGILSALLSIAGTYYLVSMPYKLRIANMERDNAQQTAVDTTAAITVLQRFISNMNLAAIDYGKNQDVLFAKLDELNKRFRDAIKAHPLPPGCLPDDARLQLLLEAVTSANSAASGAGSGFGETVRSTH